jgi:predicted oxidoreductase
MRIIDAIPTFLAARRGTHPSPDLLDAVLPHAADLEWQINVAQGNGELMKDKRGVYTDGIRSWANLRVPHDSNSLCQSRGARRHRPLRPGDDVGGGWFRFQW